MRLLLASHRYAPVAGGTELIVRLLAEGLAGRGHEVSVVTQAEPGEPTEEHRNGVRVLRLRNRRVGGVRVPVHYLRTLRRLDADVFHLHGNRIWCADFYFPAARLFSWPQLVTGHGFYQWEMRPRLRDRLYFRRYLPWVLRAFDKYVCTTEHEQRLLLGWGVPSDKVATVPLGVAVEEFDRIPEGVDAVRSSWKLTRPLAAVFVGGFFENKRVDRLIDSVAQVRDSWALIVIGQDRPGTPYDAASCERRALHADIEYRSLGALPRADVLRAIFAADAIVVGSEYEGFGLLPVEAMAAGRPFVGFSTGAIPELAATGAGVSVTDVQGFASALRRLEDRGERARIGERGRTAVVRYSPERMVDRYEAIYREISR